MLEQQKWIAFQIQDYYKLFINFCNEIYFTKCNGASNLFEQSALLSILQILYS